MFSVIKKLILTALIIIGLQTQWKGETLEVRATRWLGSSTIASEIQNIVSAGMKVFSSAVESKGRAATSKAKGIIVDAKPGERRFNIDRSTAYLKSSLIEVKSSIEEKADEVIEQGSDLLED